MSLWKTISWARTRNVMKELPGQELRKEGLKGMHTKATREKICEEELLQNKIKNCIFHQLGMLSWDLSMTM
jgi:hypothetical protein